MFSTYQHIATSYADLTLSVHDRINDLHRRAERLAPREAEWAADSGCTNVRPTDAHPRSQKAWDMLAEALAWNAISDDKQALALAEKYEGQHMPYNIGFGPWTQEDGYTMQVTPILPDPDLTVDDMPAPTTTDYPNDALYVPNAVSDAGAGMAKFEIGTMGRVLFIGDGPNSIALSSGEIKRLREFLAQHEIPPCCTQSRLTPGRHSTRCANAELFCAVCDETVYPDSSYATGYRHAQPSLHGVAVNAR